MMWKSLFHVEQEYGEGLTLISAPVEGMFHVEHSKHGALLPMKKEEGRSQGESRHHNLCEVIVQDLVVEQ
jgi:hypothetical protein